MFPKETRERKQQINELEALEKDYIKLRINYGNSWEKVDHPKTDNKWTATVKLSDANLAAKYIKYVEFEVHPTYAGDHIIKKVNHPFVLQRLAWGYFNLPIKIYWTDIVDSTPLVIDHMLVFREEGSYANKIVKLKLKPRNYEYEQSKRSNRIDKVESNRRAFSKDVRFRF